MAQEKGESREKNNNLPPEAQMEFPEPPKEEKVVVPESPEEVQEQIEKLKGQIEEAQEVSHEEFANAVKGCMDKPHEFMKVRDVEILEKEWRNINPNCFPALSALGEKEAVLRGVRSQIGQIIYCEGDEFHRVNIDDRKINNLDDARERVEQTLKDMGFSIKDLNGMQKEWLAQAFQEARIAGDRFREEYVRQTKDETEK